MVNNCAAAALLILTVAGAVGRDDRVARRAGRNWRRFSCSRGYVQLRHEAWSRLVQPTERGWKTTSEQSIATHASSCVFILQTTELLDFTAAA